MLTCTPPCLPAPAGYVMSHALIVSTNPCQDPFPKFASRGASSIFTNTVQQKTPPPQAIQTIRSLLPLEAASTSYFSAVQRSSLVQPPARRPPREAERVRARACLSLSLSPH